MLRSSTLACLSKESAPALKGEKVFVGVFIISGQSWLRMNLMVRQSIGTNLGYSFLKCLLESPTVTRRIETRSSLILKISKFSYLIISVMRLRIWFRGWLIRIKILGLALKREPKKLRPIPFLKISTGRMLKTKNWNHPKSGREKL